MVVEPDAGIITDTALHPAGGADNSDAAVGIDLLAGEPDPVDVQADSAYGTADMLNAPAQAGHSPIIKPWPLRPPVEAGFTRDDFTVDEDSATVTCPNGLTARISHTQMAIFGARCRGCPLRQRCTITPRSQVRPA